MVRKIPLERYTLQSITAKNARTLLLICTHAVGCLLIFKKKRIYLYVIKTDVIIHCFLFNCTSKALLNHAVHAKVGWVLFSQCTMLHSSHSYLQIYSAWIELGRYLNNSSDTETQSKLTLHLLVRCDSIGTRKVYTGVCSAPRFPAKHNICSPYSEPRSCVECFNSFPFDVASICIHSSLWK